VLDLRDRGRHAAAGDAEHELHDQRVVEQPLLAQLQGEPDIAGVEALELGPGAPLPERLAHAAQERQVALEDPVAEVDRAAVEARHLRVELERLQPLVALRAPAGASRRQVDDRVAAGLADAVDQHAEGVDVLRRRAVLLARVQMQHRRARPPGGHGLVDDLARRRRQVRSRLGVRGLAPGDRALDDDGVGHAKGTLAM